MAALAMGVFKSINAQLLGLRKARAVVGSGAEWNRSGALGHGQQGRELARQGQIRRARIRHGLLRTVLASQGRAL